MHLRIITVIAALLSISLIGLAEEIHPDKSGTELIHLLRQDFTPTVNLSYRNAREEMFESIDNDNGEVTLVYTGAKYQTNGIPNHNIVNTEHTWAQSKFKHASDKHQIKSDIHHLFATYSQVNSARSNNAFAEIPDHDTRKWWLSSASEESPTGDIGRYSESTSSAFEPREAHKGNVARAMFYIYAIYGDRDLDKQWFNSQLNTLIAWHFLDPADDEEIERTKQIELVQGNENPFVLDSSLVLRVFEVDTPTQPVSGLLSMRGATESALDEESDSIKIVTWNAREIFSLADVNRREEDFLDFGGDINPDIVMIQEVSSIRQVERIRDYMGLTGYYFCCSDFEQNDRGRYSSFEVGVISRFPFDSVVENDPSPDNNENNPEEPFEFEMNYPELDGLADVSTSRGFLRVRIDELKLIINVTHLKSSNGNDGQGDHKNAQKREIVAAAIATQVNRDRAKYPDFSVLVAGDFNVGETDSGKNGSSLTDDSGDGYDDTHAIFSGGLIGDLQMKSLTHDLGIETYIASDQYAGTGPIDCIYVTGEDRFTPASPGTSSFGSDHLPVTTRYILSE
ncbi:Extracellular ribonuclease precursor [Polystyrenella longa]|uniref:Extracellular ribonuclease n=1 Tax=Polystyrenella longa TaxID=2528007 RepID=A0A518CNB0_9PLAN|nr:endonuclease [Polystyrenella longa]QDU80707.1 Extracellular ribonuclease precursor [Polystyrenella longa]